MKTLIKRAQVVTPGEVAGVNVVIEDDRIACIDAAAHARADRVIDAAGFHLIPGVVDDHVHFRDPGLTHKEDLESGSCACAAGGVTTFLEMPNTSPATISVERLEEKYKLAAEKCRVNYGFYIGATLDNLEEIKVADPATTPGLKVFIGSSTGDMLLDRQDELERLFAESPLPICAHCEDETLVRRHGEQFKDCHDVAVHSKIRDQEAAIVAARRAIDLAVRHDQRFHLLHASTGAEAGLLAKHKKLITGEACPHHLFFNVDDYERLGTRIQMNPAVKTAGDNARLWAALREGAIQVIATDHAPHTLEEKSKNYPASPSGLPSIENSLALMLNEVNADRITLLEVVNWMCDAPARVWDLVDKGRIEEGYDADLVLVDMNFERKICDEEQFTKCRWSPWTGVTLAGWPVRTWVMGREVWADGEIDENVRGQAVVCDHARGGYWATM